MPSERLDDSACDGDTTRVRNRPETLQPRPYLLAASITIAQTIDHGRLSGLSVPYLVYVTLMR